MNAKELAAKLNGREYTKEITKEEEALAKKSGLVVVFGASDDLVEIRGVINDEGGVYDGGTFYLTPNKILENHEDCECPYCGFEEKMKSAKSIEAVWDLEGFSWVYRTDIPHETFDILENGDKYCRGIVFSVDDLQSDERLTLGHESQQIQKDL